MATKTRRHFVYRNLAKTEIYFIRNMRVSVKESGGGMYNPSNVYENFHFIRPRYKRLPFRKHSIFKNNLKRRLKGYGLARLSGAHYYGDVSIGIGYLHPAKADTIKRNIRKMKGLSEFIRIY